MAARVTDGPEVTMVSTLRRTSSAKARRGDLVFLRCADTQSQCFSPRRIQARAIPGGMPPCGRQQRKGWCSIRIRSRSITGCCASAEEQLSARQLSANRRRFFHSLVSLPDCRRQLITDHCHLITLSARTSTFGGIVRPICLAAFRSIMNSNFFGCSTGRSAGWPFRILSTYVAARRSRSG